MGKNSVCSAVSVDGSEKDSYSAWIPSHALQLPSVTVYIKKVSGNLAGMQLMAQFSPDADDDTPYDSDHMSSVRTNNNNFSFQVPTCTAAFFRISVSTEPTGKDVVFEISVDGV